MDLPLLLQLDTRLGYVSQLEMIKNHLSSGGNLQTQPKARVYPVSGQRTENLQKTSEDDDIFSANAGQTNAKEAMHTEDQLHSKPGVAPDHGLADNKDENHEDEILELEDHERYATFDLPGPGPEENNEQSKLEEEEEEEEEEEALPRSELPASNTDIQEEPDVVQGQDEEPASDSVNTAINQEEQISVHNDNTIGQPPSEPAETVKQFDDSEYPEYSEQPQVDPQVGRASTLNEDHILIQEGRKQVPSFKVIDDEATPQANTETRTDSPAGSYTESETNLKTTLNIPAFQGKPFLLTHELLSFFL